MHTTPPPSPFRRRVGLAMAATGLLLTLGLTGWLRAGQANGPVVKVGQKAPLFTLKADHGKPFHLKDALGKGPVVLAFFPGAFTPVCTTQLCEYSVNLPALRRMKATLIGISADDPKTLARFRKEKEIHFTLLSDPRGKVAQQFGSWFATFKKAKRSIVVLDAKGVVRRLDIQPTPATYKKTMQLLEELKEIAP